MSALDTTPSTSSIVLFLPIKLPLTVPSFSRSSIGKKALLLVLGGLLFWSFEGVPDTLTETSWRTRLTLLEGVQDISRKKKPWKCGVGVERQSQDVCTRMSSSKT